MNEPQKQKIICIGYYNDSSVAITNLGDVAYQYIMHEFFPDYDLEFASSRDVFLDTEKYLSYDGAVIGGGDIINDYFNRHITPFLKTFKGPKIAFSVGIPFPSLINFEYLDNYDHVFTRNIEDVRSIQKLLGSHRAHFIPDAALNFRPMVSKPVIKDAAPTCGMFLVGNIEQYPDIVDNISTLTAHIATTHNITLYCFNPGEDARLSENVRQEAIDSLKKKKYYPITVDKSNYTPQEMVDIMAKLDYAVCMRYHAHIFSVTGNTPLMSISSTRKTRSFMKQVGLTEYQYKIQLDGYGTPISSNAKDMIKTFNKLVKDKDIVIQREAKFLDESRLLLESKQANNLMKNINRDPVELINEFLEETGDYQNAARLLSHLMLDYPDSPYLYGLYAKLKAKGDVEDKNGIREVLEEGKQFFQDVGSKIKDILSDIFCREDKTIPLYVDIREYMSYKTAHRGGWYDACEELYKLNSKNERGDYNGIICDMYVDRTFLWAAAYQKFIGVSNYTSPWCGFIHHSQEESYSQYNTTELLKVKEFRQSLKMCLALFVLSESLADFLREELSEIAPHIKIITFVHPVVKPTETFTMSKYLDNSKPKIVQIGSWMREAFSIYRLPPISIQRKEQKLLPIFNKKTQIIKLQKAVLVGKDMKGMVAPTNFKIDYIGNAPQQENRVVVLADPPITPCRPDDISQWVRSLENWLTSIKITPVYYDVNTETLYIEEANKVAVLNVNIQHMISTVEIISYLDNEEYDDLLSKNIMFLDLVDAVAVNSILEGIVRNMPMLVNRIEGTEKILGKKYPGFYNTLDQVSFLATDEKIKECHDYLKNIDKKKYDIQYFVEHVEHIAKKLDNL